MQICTSSQSTNHTSTPPVRQRQRTGRNNKHTSHNCVSASDKQDTTTHVLQPLNSLFSRSIYVSWCQKGKPFWILLKQEMTGGSDINRTICKSFASHSRQITKPVSHHSVFTDWMPFVPCSRQMTIPARHHSIFTGRMLFLTLSQKH